MEFLNQEEERHTKEDYYLAQIAAEIRRSNVQNPKKIRPQQFLIERRVTENPKEKMVRSKSAWMGILRAANQTEEKEK